MKTSKLDIIVHVYKVCILLNHLKQSELNNQI